MTKLIPSKNVTDPWIIHHDCEVCGKKFKVIVPTNFIKIGECDYRCPECNQKHRMYFTFI